MKTYNRDMKKLLLFSFVFLLSHRGYAESHCRGVLDGQRIYEKSSADEESCKADLLSELYEGYRAGTVCLLDQTVDLQWSYGSVGKELAVKTIDCATFKNILQAEKNTMGIKFFAENNDKLAPVIECEDEDNVSHIFDGPKTASLTIGSLNDNNPLSFGKINSGSDRALSHGTFFHLKKSLKDGDYNLIVNYDTSLYTAYTDPVNPEYIKVGGVSHADQTFVEENIALVKVEKTREDATVFWSLGGGLHELNKSDTNRNFFISAATQQRLFHDWFIKYQQNGDPNKKVTTKVYNNVAQEGSTRAFFLEGNLGKRVSPDLLQKKMFKVFFDGEAGARITGVKGASFLSSTAALNVDVPVTPGVALRGTVGATTKLYVTKHVTSEKFLGVSAGSKNIQVGFQLVDQELGRLPAYLNPIPESSPNRGKVNPERSKTFRLSTKVAW
jgi:hypothetical protein